MPTQDFKGTANLSLAADGTTGRALRSLALVLAPGATPNTNINISANANIAFNAPTFTDATNLAASGSSGSFSLSADGKTITMDITPSFIGILSCSVMAEKINTASATPYHLLISVSNGNMLMEIYAQGTTSGSSWLDILDAGDSLYLLVAAVLNG